MFPALAVANQLAARVSRVRITFAGSGKEFERRHVADAQFDYFALRCRPVPGRIREALAFLADNLAGYRASSRFLQQHRVHAVVGTGGYASAPMARAAVARKVPLVLLEQNVVPGKATRWLARSATLVCAAFESNGRVWRRNCPLRVTGTPIRDGFARRPARNSEKRLVILGGSAGARSLNESVPRALYKVGRRIDGWQILHQTGRLGLDATRNLYRKLGLTATVEAFISDMPGTLAASELAVSRSGGTTLAELAAAGVPALLVPYPHAADDHQLKNAERFAAAGGAVTLDPRELNGRLDDHLAAALSGLLDESGKRTRMVSAIRRLARPDAAEDVAAMILDVISGQPHRRGLSTAA